MIRKLNFKLAVLLTIITVLLYPPVVAASDCESNCAAQQNKYMGACSYIEDTAEQNSCIRSCLAGGSACSQRCRDQESSVRINPDRLAWLSINEPVGHGTHLCSDDEHCGTGHKCCSGHCKAVDTCN